MPIYASKAQAAAVHALCKKLEDNGENPVVLDLGKSWDELSPEQQEFLVDLCEERSRSITSQSQPS